MTSFDALKYPIVDTGSLKDIPDHIFKSWSKKYFDDNEYSYINNELAFQTIIFSKLNNIHYTSVSTVHLMMIEYMLADLRKFIFEYDGQGGT